MICPNCGKEIEDNGKFCGYCGYKLVQDATRTNKSKDAEVSDAKKKKMIIGGAVLLLALILIIFGGSALNKDDDNTKSTDTDKQISEKTYSLDYDELLNSANDEDYSMYYPYSAYKAFYTSNNGDEDDIEYYDSLSNEDDLDAIDDLDLSDYSQHNVTNDIKMYKDSYEHFDTIMSVQPSVKSQKYKRNYYYIDGELVYAYVYDPDDTDDYYRYFYRNGVIYDYITPDKEYNYSKMVPTKWGCFAYKESKDLYNDYANIDYIDNDTDYILPYSDSEYLTRSDVEGLSQQDNRLAINEIYARHGYTYETEDLKEYFESKDWYESDPDINQSTWNDNMLNDYERANVNLLTTVAKERGYR